MDRPDPASYQPRISLWGHVWRSLLMLCVTAFIMISLAAQQTSQQVLLDVALGVPAWILVFFRRRHPLAIAVVITVCTAFSTIAAGPGGLAVVSLATRRRWRELVPVAVLGVSAGMVWSYVQPAPAETWWVEVITNMVVVAAFVAWGMYIGSRRELLWTLRRRAERAETEQELRVREAQTSERTRIAREMHDVLAHRISQISMRAGALGFRDDLDADELRAGLTVIQEQSHTALDDLRGVLGVLRDGKGAPLSAPQPTYADMPSLVEDARASGMMIEFTGTVRHIPEVPLPDQAGRTLYRIVQEGITNARKHAPGARLGIDISGGPDDGLTFDISNPLGFGPSRAPGAGLGLVGLAERAELAGGRLSYGEDGGTFRVKGWIPWTP